ncbi:transglycosylase domain-containing protein [Gottfriedia luciferensis]|uniref:transglycosylase domain-containing protein n=1 Tax=Gottfriedia luciferensis TaxID=178774 RepID=UPI000B4494B6|nr:transglycosylase domain-containing protein [Gottfriedia luciferensis]
MKKIIGFIIIIISFLAFYFTSEKAMMAYEVSKSIPKKKVEELPVVSLSQNSVFYDRKNNPFYIPASGDNRINLKSNEIPQLVKDIFISTEDRYFYSHKGIDLFGVARAFMVNVSNSGIEQGASTITQQLARNLYLTQARTMERKIKEIQISLQLEKQYSKDEILEMYINTIYFANRNYGIEAASKAYFSKSAKDLSIAQAAFVCSIPNNPTLYDPLRNFNNTKKRQERILGILKSQGKITEQQYQTAMKEKITLKKNNKVQEYPDYYSYLVESELKKIFSGKKGKFNTAKLSDAQQNDLKKLKTPGERVTYLQNQGLKIYTSLNPTIQAATVRAVNRGTISTNTQGAAVVVKNDTHEIVAISGGRNYEPHNLNRAFQTFRQPGSTIKPLLVYAPYIETFGATPDTKVNADNYCKGTYCPKNDSKKEYGDVTLRTAMQNSYNTAAIRLYEQLTPRVGYSYIDKFGFASITSEDRIELGRALGGFNYGMSPLEMTNAYSTFGNNGVFYENSAIQKITLRDGTVLYENQPKSVRVYNISTNETMRSMLNSVVKDGTARHIYMPLNYIGGKTGTTNDNTNLWFMGLTSNYTIGTWIGNNKQRIPIPKNYSVPPTQLIWQSIVVNSQLN